MWFRSESSEDKDDWKPLEEYGFFLVVNKEVNMASANQCENSGTGSGAN